MFSWKEIQKRSASVSSFFHFGGPTMRITNYLCIFYMLHHNNKPLVKFTIKRNQYFYLQILVLENIKSPLTNILP